jgi:predicted nucleic acid-binding Zn ribbon protein
MVPVKHVAAPTLAALIARQPLSPAKVQFAWQQAAGRPMARAAEPVLTPDGTLVLRVVDARWVREIARVQPVLLERLRAWLGRDAVERLALQEP